MVLEHYTGVHVARVLVKRDALGLVLLSKVVAKYVVIAIPVWILAIFAHFSTLYLLIINLDLLFLIADLALVAVVLRLHCTLYVVIGELRLHQVHLGTELRRLPQLGIALRRDCTPERLAIFVVENARLLRALPDSHVNLLSIFMVVVEGCHVFLRVLVCIGLPNLYYYIVSLRS